MAYVFKFDSMPNVGFLWEGLAGFASATSKADTSVTGMILLAFRFYTAIMWVASLRISGMMAHVIFLQVFGKDILPVGKPWITPQPALKTVALGVSAASES